MLSVPHLPRATQQHRAEASSFLDDTCATKALILDDGGLRE